LNAQYGNTNPETIPLEEMTICAADKKLKVKIYLRHISLEDKDQLLKPLNYTIDILYALKNK